MTHEPLRNLRYQNADEHINWSKNLNDTIEPVTFDAKVLTVSDSVHLGTREDRSGPALVDFLVTQGFRVTGRRTVLDGIAPVAAALQELSSDFHGLILTTGGTGFAPTDLTPEATESVLEREAPGIAEAMRAVNPLGRLTRGRAGTIGTSLIVNLPGSTKGALECAESIVDVVPHILELLGGQQPH